MKAMVLAAGVGSRLDPLTAQTPKPLVPVANRPVLEHLLSLLKRHGITEVVSNLHHLPDKLIEYFGDGSKFGMNLKFHYEEQLSGDAGGVRACRRFLGDETFLVLMGDLLTDADITAVVQEHKAKRALATIGTKQVDDVSQFGVVLTDKDGFVTGFQEKPAPHEALSNFASTGIYVLEPEIFNYVPAEGAYGFGRQLFPLLVEQGQPVLGVELSGYWSDVGTIQQYRLSNFDALQGRVQVDLPGVKSPVGWLGGNSHIGEGCRISGNLMLGKNSRLGRDSKISGCVIIGDNCFVGQGAELEDTVVWSDTNVADKAVLKDSVISANCVVNCTRQAPEPSAIKP